MALDKLVTEVQEEIGSELDVEKLMATVDDLRYF